MSVVYEFFWLIGLALQVLLLGALIRGPWGRFPLLFVFVVTLFLTSIIDGASFLGFGAWTEQSRRYFWINDAIRQLLVFAVVISLALRAMTGTPLAHLRGTLTVAAVSFVVLSLVLTRDDRLGTWMTNALRNVSFCAMVVDLVLWTALISSRRRDLPLLLVSSGIGLQLAGEALGQSVRQLAIEGRSRLLADSGNLILALSHLLCLLVLWQAMRKQEAEQPAPAEEATPAAPSHHRAGPEL